MTITDPDHVSTAARLREAFSKPRPATSNGQYTEVAVRDLAVYDAAFSVDLDTALDTALDTVLDTSVEEAS